MTATMTAADFAHTLRSPVLRYTSLAEPSGCDVALLDETELPVDLAEVSGSVVDGQWTWDGEGSPRDARRNTVTGLWLRDDEGEYDRQRDQSEIVQ